MKRLKVGHRVAVYGAADSCAEWPNLYCRGNKGTVAWIVDKDHEIGIEFDYMEGPDCFPSALIHPKQCRRLRTKKVAKK